jgi:lipoprotein-anchoring transpeptidase ErfK/SrfK
MNKHMRRLFLLSSLAGAGLGIGLAAAQAQSQYSYPPGGYRGVERDGVMTIAPDDDDNDRPPVQRRAGPRSSYDPPVEALPPAEPLPPPDRYNRPAYGAMPPYNEPYVPSPYAPPPPPGYAAPSGYAPAPGPYAVNPPETRPDVPRPPQAVGAPANVAPGAAAPGTIAGLPPEDQPEVGQPKQLKPQFRRQVVPYQTKQPAGTIVIDTPSTFLYFVNGDGTAIRYGIGVGRDGFTWAGTEKITRMAEWPDWHPPAEMIERQPYLPRFMAGGESNPLGARALYLGKTIYRVHGTNQPSTIGSFVSSGCIRMLNADVEDLYTRVKVGTKVVVLGDGKGPPPSASAAR